MDVVTGRTCPAGRGMVAPAAVVLLSVMLAAAESRPAASAPASRPVLPPIVQAATAAEALEYDQAEATILADVEDRGEFDIPALYVLLRRAEMLPEGRAVLDQADRPNLLNLWSGPARYRGQLIRVSGRYGGRVTVLTQTASRTLRWPYPRPVWAMDVIVEFGRDVPPRRMVVVMGRQPPKGLVKYQAVQFAGIFLKRATLPQAPDDGDPAVKNQYPVIVARRAYTVAAPPARVPVMFYVILGLVVVLLIAFFLLRRKIAGAAPRAGGYRPLRFEDARRGAEENQAAAEEVDEDLRREVASYLARREKQAEENNGKDAKDSS